MGSRSRSRSRSLSLSLSLSPSLPLSLSLSLSLSPNPDRNEGRRGSGARTPDARRDAIVLTSDPTTIGGIQGREGAGVPDQDEIILDP